MQQEVAINQKSRTYTFKHRLLCFMTLSLLAMSISASIGCCCLEENPKAHLVERSIGKKNNKGLPLFMHFFALALPIQGILSA